MKPTEELKEEHKVILRMLKILEKASQNLDEVKRLNLRSSRKQLILSAILLTNVIMAKKRIPFSQ